MDERKIYCKWRGLKLVNMATVRCGASERFLRKQSMGAVNIAKCVTTGNNDLAVAILRKDK